MFDLELSRLPQVNIGPKRGNLKFYLASPNEIEASDMRAMTRLFVRATGLTVRAGLAGASDSRRRERRQASFGHLLSTD